MNLDVSGARSNIPLWTIFEPPLGNAIVHISQNWSGGGMLNVSRDEVSIACTVDKNIYYRGMGPIYWGANVIDV